MCNRFISNSIGAGSREQARPLQYLHGGAVDHNTTSFANQTNELKPRARTPVAIPVGVPCVLPGTHQPVLVRLNACDLRTVMDGTLILEPATIVCGEHENSRRNDLSGNRG